MISNLLWATGVTCFAIMDAVKCHSIGLVLLKRTLLLLSFFLEFDFLATDVFLYSLFFYVKQLIFSDDCSFGYTYSPISLCESP